jgi:Protein of unknown function (DUF3055)
MKRYIKGGISVGDHFYLYNDLIDTKTRFVSFMGEESRFDLAITITDRFYGKKLVLNLQSNRFAIIGPDDLEEEGYLEHAFQITEAEAVELSSFLLEVI